MVLPICPWIFGFRWRNAGLAIQYQRHQPEQTPLYGAVLSSYKTLLAKWAAKARALPNFIAREFAAYLQCGILGHGFARIRCKGCGHSKLLAFSCKKRGFCPSCGGRFMAEKAAHLVDAVVPEVPVRQWVLSLPIPLRYLIAYNSGLQTAVLGCFIKAVTAI